MSSPRPGRRGNVLPRNVRAALAIAVAAAGLFSVSAADGAATEGQYLIFTWGERFKFLEQSVDFDAARLNLKVGDDDTLSVPLSSISKVIDAKGNTTFDFTLDDIALDAWDPLDASLLKPILGWSQEEVWDVWDNEPKWAFRWTEGAAAMAMISRPSGHSDALELRLFPISYPQRELGGDPAPEVQFVRVTLDGRLLGDLPLTGDGWHTYRLALPRSRDSVHSAAFLKLEASHTARPVDFSQGLSIDDRNLGVAVDYVRFVSTETDTTDR
jgi:hypothetical protein